MIGIDLDGTLAYYDNNMKYSASSIGEPIPKMLALVKDLIIAGKEVQILTARVCSDQPTPQRLAAKVAVERWCKKHIGVVLKVTAEKHYSMELLIDDRAVACKPNDGSLKFFITQFNVATNKLLLE